jgi:hypothetical protein
MTFNKKICVIFQKSTNPHHLLLPFLAPTFLLPLLDMTNMARCVLAKLDLMATSLELRLA